MVPLRSLALAGTLLFLAVTYYFSLYSSGSTQKIAQHVSPGGAPHSHADVPLHLTKPSKHLPAIGDAGAQKALQQFALYSPPANASLYSADEHGNGDKGKHFHVRPPKLPTHPGFETCEYPILIHSTPNDYCTGALALYASLVRSVMLQPEILKGKVCVHITYVEEKMKTLEEMYRWVPVANPFTHIPACGLLDSMPEWGAIVPVRWQAIPPIELPPFMQAVHVAWNSALNKVYSWAFDLYPRVLILDGDSIILQDLDLIFDDIPSLYTVAGADDQFSGCHDRTRLNGGMILLRPSRYFQIVASELLYDPNASCFGGSWQQSEQELINCICGFGTSNGLRPEFACSIMPLYNSVWPQNFGCSDASIVPTRSIHFIGGSKPWVYTAEVLNSREDLRFWGCLRDVALKGDVQALLNCQVDVDQLYMIDQPTPVA